jgi:hypothetical protein
MALLLMALALFGGSPSAGLHIAVWPQGQQGPRHIWTLGCAPTSGTLPLADAACTRLDRFSTNPFAPVPPGTFCSQIFSGPEEALVTGMFRGSRVWARFNRQDSCQTARWNRIKFLFVASAATK